MSYIYSEVEEDVFWAKVKNFKRKEFECKCGCGENRINHELVFSLDMAVSEMKRLRKDFKCIVTSGCRCQKHNDAQAGSVKNSSHVVRVTENGVGHKDVRECLAADISCMTSEQRYFMLPHILRYFRRVEISDRHIHVDVDYEKPMDLLFFPPGTSFGWRK